jgi:hypothetical protein
MGEFCLALTNNSRGKPKRFLKLGGTTKKVRPMAVNSPGRFYFKGD